MMDMNYMMMWMMAGMFLIGILTIGAIMLLIRYIWIKTTHEKRKNKFELED